MNVLDIAAVILIVGFVIGRQLVGEQLRGKRLLALPAVLIVVGAVELFGGGHHPGAADIGLITAGVVVAAGIGAGQGSMMHLEAREGTLWGKMPGRSLWLWVALVLSRLVIEAVASGLGAHMAASGGAILFTFGVNRLAQAAVIAPRAMAGGIPFTPEKDGSTVLSGVFVPGHPDRVSGVPSAPTPRNNRTLGNGRLGNGTLGNGALGDEWRSGVRLIADRLAQRDQPR